MRAPRPVVTCAIFLAAWAASAASAARARADTALQAAIDASTGFTDNALSVPSDNPQSARQSDVFATIAPSLTLLIDQPRVTGTLTARGSFQQFVSQSDANSRFGGASGALAWEAAPTWRLVFDLNGTIGEQGVFDTLTSIGAVPQKGGTYLQASSGVAALKDFSPTWRGTEGLRVTLFDPLDDQTPQPRSLSIESTTSAQLSFKRDAAALSLATTVNSFEARGAQALPADKSLFMTLEASWLHEISVFWGLAVDAGGGFVTTGGGITAAPVAKASLSYRRDLTNFSVEAAQRVAADTLLGLSDLRTEVTLNLLMRLSDTFSVRAIGGAIHDETVNSDLTINSLRFGTGVTYRPRDDLEFDLDQAFLFQKPNAPTPLVPDLVRNTITLTVRAYWPNRRATTQDFLQQNLRVRQSEEWDQTEAKRGGRQ